MRFKQPIAIVGMGGFFPKAPDIETFWNNVAQGLSADREVPPGRWTLSVDNAVSKPGVPDKAYSSRGCFIDDFNIEDHIDMERYEIDPGFIKSLDPLYSVTLIAGIKALEDAKDTGFNPERTSVILGNIALPTDKSSALSWEILGGMMEEKVTGKKPDIVGLSHPLNRYVTGMPAGLLAKILNLGGGTYTLDAACASSLYAVKLAVDELQSGRADAVFSGGVSRPDCLYTQMGFSQLSALSPNGICSPFDEKANGLVMGEGAGIVMLKRLDDALRDNNRIYGVIRGVGLSNDQAGNLLAPDSEGQIRSMKEAYSSAGWKPSDVDLVECHGTGTPVGDVVEFESLKRLWIDEKWKPNQCVIGSVKSNIGHLLTGAGAAGLIKVLMAINNKTLPPMAHYESPNPKLGIDESPFAILQKSRKWQRRDESTPRRAAVSAFGFGGINAHVLIEEWTGNEPVAKTMMQDENRACPVAIVGLGAHFGPWTDIEKFKERVLRAEEPVEPYPHKGWYGAEKSSWIAGIVKGRFDFAGYGIDEIQVGMGRFRIPPMEMKEMLPQQLLMLKAADEALKDAGAVNADHTRSSAIIGIQFDFNTTNFHARWNVLNHAKRWAKKAGMEMPEDDMKTWIKDLQDEMGPPLNANRTMGALGSIVASRIAREYKFGGPSFTVSSEESSGLRAIEVALRKLQTGGIDLALAGTVDLPGDVRALIVSDLLKRNPERNYGEGAAAFVLKRLDDAERDGDKIYAVIRGVGSAHGGDPGSVRPEYEAYVKSLQRACLDAGCDKEDVTCLELRSTGDNREDETEALAASDTFGGSEDLRENPCSLSSVTQHVGDSCAAGGASALAKTALALYHQVLPGFHNKTITQTIGDSKVFYTPGCSQYWLRNRKGGPRTTAVSSFSADGNCIHAIVQAYEPQNAAAKVDSRPFRLKDALFVFEGDTAAEITASLKKMQDFLKERPALNVNALAAAWYKTRRPLFKTKRAAAVVASDRARLSLQVQKTIDALATSPEKPINTHGKTLMQGFNTDGIFYSSHPLGPKGKTAFVFPGSGNHYPQMGRRTALHWPGVLNRQDSESLYLRRQIMPEIFWNLGSLESIKDNHNALIAGQVTLGTIMCDLLERFHIRPRAVLGYSLGETAGMFGLRAWTDRDRMLEKLNSTSLFLKDLGGPCRAAKKTWNVPEENQVEWAIGVLDAPPEKVKNVLTNGRKRVYLLIMNTPEESVIGGQKESVFKLVEDLGCNFFPIQGVTTVHCEVVKAVEKPYREFHLYRTTPPEGVDFYSTAWGDRYDLSKETAADAILAQALDRLDFPAVVRRAHDDGVRTFIEIGPGNSCSRMINSILKGREYTVRSACMQDVDEVSSIIRLLAHLVAERAPVKLDYLYENAEVYLADARKRKKSASIILKTGHDDLKPPEAPQIQQEPAPTPAAVVPQTHAPATVVPSPRRDDVFDSFEASQTAALGAHQSYLNLTRRISEAMTRNMELQMSIIRQNPDAAAKAFAEGSIQPVEPVSPVPSTSIGDISTVKCHTAPTPYVPQSAVAIKDKPIFMNREQCMEFATGSIAKVLGEAYAEIDKHPKRVRLPDEPLMLVDRIIEVEGEPLSLTNGRVITEHDIHPGAWYLDGGAIPTCIAVEAGQADLFLSGYLGIDTVTKGHAVYRLLDAVVTFHQSLPKPGSVIRYDIRILRFFRQGDTYLFKFEFDSTVNGKPMLTMRDGCAGFFTNEELAAGQGVVQTALDKRPMKGTMPDDWQYPVPMQTESYSDDQLDALRKGNLKKCFGPLFKDLPVKKPLTIPGGRMKLVNRIFHLDPKGGRFGLGIVHGEADIHPDDWFLTCHFSDDNVMPGTLMYECCMHTLRVFLLRMGWIAEEADAVWEPAPGVSSGLKCRGQVIETTKRASYEMTVKELGYAPEPYCIADGLMYADGKPVVEITNMSCRLNGVTKDAVKRIWADRGNPIQKPDLETDEFKPAIFDNDSILAFAIGKPSKAFGEKYKVFDEDRIIARLPGPPYKFLDRIVKIEGCKQWEMSPGGVIEAQYRVPEHEWYFDGDRQGYMPFAVLLEIALQPCGWLAAYVGSALTSDIDLSFRNLGGSGVIYEPVKPGAGILTTKVKMTRASTSGGMIIQHYDFKMYQGGRPVYIGDTYFGFFSKAALADQVGIRDAAIYKPSKEEIDRAESMEYPKDTPFPNDMLRMIDNVDLYVKDGGPHGLGYIRGSMKVEPDDWFFKAHFYQDPVIPGSLGLESMLQLMKVMAWKKWQPNEKTTMLTMIPGMKHQWTYRGQVIPPDKKVTVDCWITSIDNRNNVMFAEGFLTIDGRIIYHMKDFSIRLLNNEA